MSHPVECFLKTNVGPRFSIFPPFYFGISFFIKYYCNFVKTVACIRSLPVSAQVGTCASTSHCIGAMIKATKFGAGLMEPTILYQK